MTQETLEAFLTKTLIRYQNDSQKGAKLIYKIAIDLKTTPQFKNTIIKSFGSNLSTKNEMLFKFAAKTFIEKYKKAPDKQEFINNLFKSNEDKNQTVTR